MSAQAEPCGEPGRRGPRGPLGRWQPGQGAGRPPLLEPRWVNVDWLQRALAACSWPLCTSAPLFVPSQEVGREQYTWRVSVDVAPFSSTEITLGIRGGFLEVEGKHGERPDEHGFTARCFTRKYRLPSDADVSKMAATLSGDGILTVEAPVPETSVPAAIVIPIKVEIEEQEIKQEGEETDPDSSRAPKAQRLRGPLEPEDYGKDSPPEVHADKAPAGSCTAELQQHGESREQDTHEKPAGESHPSVSADGEDIESCRDSSEHREATESQESPDTSAPKEPEHEEPAVNGEIQIRADSGEAAEHISQQEEEPELGKSQPSEGQSQELEVPDKKQDPAE